MKERSIIMSAEEVRAILDGRKTQFRRPIKPQPLWQEEPASNGQGLFVGRYQCLIVNRLGEPDADVKVDERTSPHVGSSLEKKDGWRDVDVRVILDDEVWDAMGLGDPANPHSNAKWVAYCLALSSFGRDLTGLPIDCQLQRGTEANAEYSSSRSFLGLMPELLKPSGQ